MKDIAILNLTRFGDLIQTTPVLKGLRKRYPEARLHLIIKSRFGEVTPLLPEVDQVHEIDGDWLAATLSQPDLPFLERFRRVRELVEKLRALAEERAAVLRCGKTQDQIEGMRAFLEKRPPVFTGK